MASIVTWPESVPERGERLRAIVEAFQLLFGQPIEGRSGTIATEPETRDDPAWNDCIDALLSTLSSPAFDDDLVIAPNAASITAALKWVVWLHKTSPSAPPTLIVREPSGGIIIARRQKAPNGDDLLTELAIYNDLSAEATRYRNGRVVGMSPIMPHPPRGSYN